MIESSVNGKDAKTRIQCLDLLRGFFVFLALWQHFSYYLNFWYINYYQGWSFWGELLEPHASFVGTQLPVDYLSGLAAWFFTPWVSQIYLFLAAFNLGRIEKNDNIKPKIFVFLGLFLLFTVENMFVAPNIGEALSLYPLQTWMICLLSVTIFYHYLGEKSVWALLFIGLGCSVVPIDNFYIGIEQNLRSILHDNFEIDARPHYFISSACLGFLFGKSWWSENYKRFNKFLITGAIAFTIWLIWGETFIVDAKDVFLTEHDQAKSLVGLIGIHGVELLVTGFFLLVYKRGFDFKIPLLNWVGRYSLLVFVLHRLIFLKVIMPFRMLLYNITDIKIEIRYYEIWAYILFVVFCAWLIRKLKILTYLEGK